MSWFDKATERRPPAEIRSPRAIDDPIDVGRTTDGGPSFGTRWKASWLDEPEKVVEVFAKERFPDLTPAQAKARYMIKDGEIMYYDKGGKLVPEKGQGLGETLVDLAATITGGKLPSTAGGVVGALYGGPVGAAAGSGVGELIRQGVGRGTSDDPMNYGEVGLEAILGAGGELAGRGVANVAKRAGRAGSGPLGKITTRMDTRLDRKTFEKLLASGQRHGIDMTAVDLIPSSGLRRTVEQLRGLPGSEDVIFDWMRLQRNPQIQEAVEGFLKNVSPESSVLKANEKAVQASRRAIGEVAEDGTMTGAKGARQAASEPAYREAFEAAPPIDDETINAVLELPQFQQAYKRARRIAALEGEDLPARLFDPDTGDLTEPLTVKTLDYIKKGIDDLVGDRGPKSTLGKQERALLIKRKNEMLERLDELVPEYRKARQTFARASKPVEAAEEALGKVAKLEGFDATKASRTILDSSLSSPESVRAAKGLIQAEDPAAWDALIRANMQERFDKVLFETVTGDPKNIGGLFQQNLLGKESQKKIWEAALEPEQYQNLLDFGELLRATGAWHRGGSRTAMNEVSIREMSKEGAGRLPNVLRGINPLQWPEMLAQKMEARNLDKFGAKITDALLSPDGIRQIQRIKELPPGSQEQIAAMGVFMTQVADSAIRDDEPGGPDREFQEQGQSGKRRWIDLM